MTRPVSAQYPRSKAPSIRRLRDALPVPLERDEQRTLLTWAALQCSRWPELALLFAIPNGGHRDVRVAAQLKAEGVKPGVPDLCLPVARGGYHGLFVELKRRSGGTVSPHQRRWYDALIAEGYSAHIVAGWEAARDTLLNYLNLEVR